MEDASCPWPPGSAADAGATLNRQNAATKPANGAARPRLPRLLKMP